MRQCVFLESADKGILQKCRLNDEVSVENTQSLV